MTENQLNEMFRLLTVCVTTTQEIKVSVANLETRIEKLENEFHEFRDETNRNFDKVHVALDLQNRKNSHLFRDNLDLKVRVEKLEEENELA